MTVTKTAITSFIIPQDVILQFSGSEVVLAGFSCWCLSIPVCSELLRALVFTVTPALPKAV